jgi:N-acetylmuramoyl-L-alanine amidase
VVLLGVMTAGCAKRTVVQSRSEEIPGYTRLRAELGDRDFTPLRGRCILLDPGHGGYFAGAVGANGLTEAEVNLGVALYLRGLLEWAGADVYLTRTADYDFLTPADSSLAADLAARVALADSLQPDVFVSIHHNSTATRDPNVNETQTYYPIGRDGPDLDLARAIHKHLVRMLEIHPAKIMPGNFHVLRNAPVPAVLGEPAMISNPVIEGRLSLARSQELEAQAYFLGLLEYFAGGTPRFVHLYVDPVVIGEGSRLVFRFDPGGPAAPGLDPASVELRVDGALRPVALASDGELRWRPTPPDLRTERKLTLRARNLAGRAVPTVTLQLRCDDPGSWTVTAVFENDSTGIARKVLLVYESGGVDLARLVRLRLEPLARSDPRYRPFAPIPLPTYPGRRGWAMLDPDVFDDTASPPPVKLVYDTYYHSDVVMVDNVIDRVHWRRSAIEAPWRFLVVLPAPGSALAVVPGGSWTPRLFADGYDPQRSIPRIDPAAPVLPVRRGEAFWIEAPGALPVFADRDHRPHWPSDAAAAAESPHGDPPDTLYWQPLLPALVGKTIVLDPTGGGPDDDGTGPLGTRGALLNLEVAEKTAALLRGAGCRVVLTREDETWVPNEHKILLANRENADLFLTIGRTQNSAGSVTAAHHHGSAPGEIWARDFGRAYAPLLAAGDSLAITPSWAYLLRHTACPALAVGLPRPETMAAEERLANPYHQHATARALLLSVAALLEDETVFEDVVDPARLLAALEPAGPSADAIAWIRFDGNFFWLPPAREHDTAAADSSLTFTQGPGLPAYGPYHTLEVRAGGTSRFWALRRNARGAWDGRLLFSMR